MLLITICTAFGYCADRILMLTPHQTWDLCFAVSKLTIIIGWIFAVRCCWHCKRAQCWKPRCGRIRDWTFQELFAQTPLITPCLPLWLQFFYLSAPAFSRRRGNVAFYFQRSMWKPLYLYNLLESLLLDNYGSPVYILDPNLKKINSKGSLGAASSLFRKSWHVNSTYQHSKGMSDQSQITDSLVINLFRKTFPGALQEYDRNMINSNSYNRITAKPINSC